MKLTRLFVLFGVLLVLAACGPADPTPPPTPTRTPVANVADIVTEPPTEAPTAEPTSTPVPVYGPDSYPETINPLTGQAVDDPAVLVRPPVLIKVSNESNQVRPQSGLSYADHVWMYQMEGWGQTRYTAVYYGDAPEYVGSVRSVRLIDTDYLIHMYDGLLVFSGTSLGLGTIVKYADWNARAFLQGGPHLERIPNIPHEGMNGYHSLFAHPDEVWNVARDRGVFDAPTLSGLAFTATVPEGGAPTSQITVDYPGRGPALRWQYDEASGLWLQSQQMQRDGEEGFTVDKDYITGEQLDWENVVVIYSDYYLADFIEDEPNQLLSIGPVMEGEGEAVLLRDGQRYLLTWRRSADDPTDFIRFYDEVGEIVPFKPGQTFFNVITYPGFDYAPTVDYE